MKNYHGFPKEHWDTCIKDKCKCVYCEFDGTKFENWRQLQIDHIIPKSKGGDDSVENLAVACCRCNQHKKDFDPGQSIKLTLGDKREKLIELAKKYVKKKIDEEKKAFDAMIKELKDKYAPW